MTSYLVPVFCIALAGVGAFQALGRSVHSSVAGDAETQVRARSHGTSAGIATSTQAAVSEALLKLTHAAIDPVNHEIVDLATGLKVMRPSRPGSLEEALLTGGETSSGRVILGIDHGGFPAMDVDLAASDASGIVTLFDGTPVAHDRLRVADALDDSGFVFSNIAGKRVRPIYGGGRNPYISWTEVVEEDGVLRHRTSGTYLTAESAQTFTERLNWEDDFGYATQRNDSDFVLPLHPDGERSFLDLDNRFLINRHTLDIIRDEHGAPVRYNEVYYRAGMSQWYMREGDRLLLQNGVLRQP